MLMIIAQLNIIVVLDTRLYICDTSWWCAGWEEEDHSRAAPLQQPLLPVLADRTATLAAGTSVVVQKPATKKKGKICLYCEIPAVFAFISSPHCCHYLIGLYRRVLDHHALHLVAHTALLVASESEGGGWLHAHDGLVTGSWVWHHSSVD